MNAVFVDCTPELSALIEQQRLSVPSGIKIHRGDPSLVELARMAREAEILMVEHTIIAESVLQDCSRLKGIVFMGTGAGSYVPVEFARAHGIAVVTTPGYGNTAVAEHAMALTFAAARQIVRMDAEIRAGAWLPAGGLQLKGSKVAVVGLGEIGRTYAEMASALGMRVAAWNRSRLEHPCFVDDLDEALRDADFISLHLALNDQTRHIIDARRLALLRPGAVLVNTARADLVDEAALQRAIGSGQVGHAALDVLWTEPLAPESPWRTEPHATLTAHAAYMTEEAYIELWHRTMQAVERLATGAA